MQLPIDNWVSGFRTPTNGVTSRMTERYRTWLRAKFATIDDLNRAYIEENLAFQTIIPPNELLDKPNWKPSGGRKWDDWLTFKAQLPAEFRIPIRKPRAG